MISYYIVCNLTTTRCQLFELVFRLKLNWLQIWNMEIWNFLQTFWKDVLFKMGRPGTWTVSERWPSSRNTCKYDIFCVDVRVLQTWCHASLPKKNQRWYYPAKIHLEVIDALDSHPRKSSSNSLYFHGDLCRRFHVLLSSEKI